MLILASNSKRRIEFLKNNNYDFIIISSDFDESTIKLNNKKLPIVLSYNKALSVKNSKNITNNDIILAADTIVLYKKEILGKPKDYNDCFNMLKKLNNNTHKVITGVTIIQDKKIKKFKCTSKVKFKNLTDNEINDYILKENPLDKAGGYGIQDNLSPVLKYTGSYENIVGLPIKKVMRELKKYGCIPKKN